MDDFCKKSDEIPPCPILVVLHHSPPWKKLVDLRELIINKQYYSTYININNNNQLISGISLLLSSQMGILTDIFLVNIDRLFNNIYEIEETHELKLLFFI